MSWEAVTWASKQAMKLPQEQLVLLVVANCADPDGVAFSEWRGSEHWWKYLCRRTRLSKSSLFRHINTLVALGLATRGTLVLADGTRRPTIRLDLVSGFNIEDASDKEVYSRLWDQSHGETETEEAPDNSERTHDINSVQEEIHSAEIHSHGETGPAGGNEPQAAIPAGGTEPFPIVGTHIDSSKSCSKDSPLPPGGGPSVPDDGWEEFRKAWLRPIERLSVAKAVWDHIPTARRGEVTTAARGYWLWVGKQPKPPAVLAAQTFLRDAAGWAQWLPYAPDASGIAPSISIAHRLETPEAKAIVTLHEIAGLGSYVHSVMIRQGVVNYLRPVTPRMRPLADAGPKDNWVVLERKQAASWEGFLRETVTVQARKHLREGDRAPWPWPPSTEGKIYTTGPPETLMSEKDYADFK